MKVCVDIPEEMISTARRYVPAEMSVEEIIYKALENFVRAQAGRRLMALGGAAGDMNEVPRRRLPPDGKGA